MWEIFDAIARKDRDAVSKAIAAGFDLEEVDPFGRTPLLIAVLIGDSAVVELLLSAGANPKHTDSNGYTALHFAAQAHAQEAAQMLIDHGAEVDAVDNDGNTPLARATFASRGRGELITLLLKAGASPDLQNHHGVSARSLAMSVANYDLSKFFPE